MTFAEALRVLEERQETRIELGLGRVRAVLRRLGDPQEAVPCFHVAGTNGKGSTCAMLESVLRASGLKTGLYISPHLRSPVERIAVAGLPIAEADLARLMGAALDAERGEAMTYFELLTVTAFLYFREKGVAAAVLETGLGGRLDATNVVRRPLATIVTSIAFDHMQFLGSTLEAIAGEKAAIAKTGCPMIAPPLPEPAARVVAEACRRIGAPLKVAPAWQAKTTLWDEGAQTLWSGGGGYRVSLLGDAQASNAALVKAALDAAAPRLGPPREEALAAGLASTRWPGRFEARRLSGGTAILDGAHNPEAAARFAATWSRSPWAERGRARFILGVLKDKDVAGILRALAPVLTDVSAVAPPSPRALSAEALARAARRWAPRARVTAAASLEEALGAPGHAAVAIVGSFYLVGQALALLESGRATATAAA